MGTNALILAWLPWYALGLAVETPVFAFLGRVATRGRSGRPSWARLAFAGAIGTAVTHPLFVFVWPHVVRSYLGWVVSGEIIVVVVETFIFFFAARKVSLCAAALCSLAANALSLVAGLAIRAVCP